MPSVTRTAGGTCSGCWPPTGVWDLTCSPISSHPTLMPAPASRSPATSAQPPRPRQRSPCCVLPTPWTCSQPRAGQAPTLVLHRRGDRAAPFDQGRVLADAIPGAELVELEGRSHLPAFGDVESLVEQVRRFLGLPRLRRTVPTGLTDRQTEVAALVAEGLTNRELADRLRITERSAESHLERIRLRLGFRSRSQVAAWYVARPRTSEVIPRLRRGGPPPQHGGMSRRPAHLLLSAAGWLGFVAITVWTMPSSPTWSSPGPSTDLRARPPPARSSSTWRSCCSSPYSTR